MTPTPTVIKHAGQQVMSMVDIAHHSRQLQVSICCIQLTQNIRFVKVPLTKATLTAKLTQTPALLRCLGHFTCLVAKYE